MLYIFTLRIGQDVLVRQGRSYWLTRYAFVPSLSSFRRFL